LLPQSSAATASVTNRFDSNRRRTNHLGDEFAHGIVRSHEIVRQMRVQTLHAHPGAPHAAAGLDCIDSNSCETTSFGILVMSSPQPLRINELFESMDSAVALESTHGFVQFGVNEPEQCRHRCRVAKMRLILDHDRPTVEAAYDHRTATARGTAQEDFYGCEVTW
jgi:hypothetical protein